MLPETTAVLSKTGNLERASNLAGIVVSPSGPVVVAVLDEDVGPGDARLVIARSGRAIDETYGR